MGRNFDLVREAIESRQQIHATYHGHPRQMCPHALGWKNGKAKAIFYQFAGSSAQGLRRDGSPANWRCILVEDLKNVRIVDGEWHTAGNHSRPQSCVDDIEVEVGFLPDPPDWDDEDDD